MAEMEDLELDLECGRIKQLREKHGISQKELAEMLHVAPSVPSFFIYTPH